MGRKRVVGLDWLDSENTNQRLWALKYLQAKGLERIFHNGERILPDELPSHNEMLDAGMYIEQGTGARQLFSDMKDAWRQERDRNKKKEAGRQVCVFTLCKATKNHLKTMAKEQKQSPTVLLESMITKAYTAHVRRQQRQLSKQTLQGSRHHTIQDLHEMFVGGVIQPDNSAIPSRSLAEKSVGEPELLKQKSGEHTSSVSNERSSSQAAPEIVEPLLEHEEAITLIPDSPSNSQKPSAAAEDDQPEQSAPVDLNSSPTDDFPHTQTDNPSPVVKISPQKRKMFRLSSDRLPKAWDKEQSD
jgi:hypothetical protein